MPDELIGLVRQRDTTLLTFPQQRRRSIYPAIDDAKIVELQLWSAGFPTRNPLIVATFGNPCLSMRCRRRFCGVEHFRSQSSTKQAYVFSPLACSVSLSALWFSSM